MVESLGLYRTILTVKFSGQIYRYIYLKDRDHSLKMLANFTIFDPYTPPVASFYYYPWRDKYGWEMVTVVYLLEKQ